MTRARGESGAGAKDTQGRTQSLERCANHARSCRGRSRETRTSGLSRIHTVGGAHHPDQLVSSGDRAQNDSLLHSIAPSILPSVLAVIGPGAIDDLILVVDRILSLVLRLVSLVLHLVL